MVTLKMLAQACNVSIATVSKALNGAPDIGSETAARIQKTAQQMGYIPSAAARNLKTNRSHCFGVIFDDGTESGLAHEFFANMLESFKHQAELMGYDIFLISGQSGPWGSDYVSHARYRNCDGVLIMVGDNVVSCGQELVMAGIPAVAVDYGVDNCSTIHSDNVRGMAELVRYVHGQGHRTIAAVFGEDCPVTRLRAASFYRTCAELGVEVPDEYVRTSLYHDMDSAILATRQLLALPRRPTCILYPDDYAAIGGMNEIERAGLSIPGDVSVTGFDGSLLARYARPRMTTVQQNTRDMGIAAARELVRAVEEGRGFLPRDITIPCTLLSGETVRKLGL